MRSIDIEPMEIIPQTRIPKPILFQSIFSLEVITQVSFFLCIPLRTMINSKKAVIKPNNINNRYKFESIPRSVKFFSPLSVNLCKSPLTFANATTVMGICPIIIPVKTTAIMIKYIHQLFLPLNPVDKKFISYFYLYFFNLYLKLKVLCNKQSRYVKIPFLRIVVM